MTDSKPTKADDRASGVELEVLNVAEAAALLRVSKVCVYTMAKGVRGFPVRRVGKNRLRFSRRALLAWLAKAA